MASTQDDPANALRRAVPRQRECEDLAQILADDRLVEAIRTGWVTGDDPANPLVRMLVSWRAQTYGGT